MNFIQFSDTQKKHKCYGEREGEWVVFRCPVCDDFERRFHANTGEMHSRCDPENEHKHYGFFIPPGLDADVYVPN